MGSSFDGKVALRTTGLLKGSVLVDSLERTTVREVKAEIKRLMGPLAAQTSIKIIAAGRPLQDDSKTLSEAGMRATTSLLVIRGGHAGDVTAAEAEAERLARLKAAAEAMVSRETWGTNSRSMSVENQQGQVVELAKEDREALMIGLALHQKGKKTLAAERLKEAYAELSLAEESFGCCKSDILQSVDNVGMLKLDLVWTAFLLQDSGMLAVSKERLLAARTALSKAHGPNLERLRRLHGGFQPEAAVYVRLELLEGALALYSGRTDEARAKLTDARARWQTLEVCDDAVAQLAAMGFTDRAARRSLRFTKGNVQEAAQLIQDEGKRVAAADAARAARAREEKAMRVFGRTAGGKLVDPRFLETLSGATGLGYDRLVAAEALRVHENDLQKALDELCEPEKRDVFAASVAAKLLSRAARQAQSSEARRARRRRARSKRRRSPTARGSAPSESHEAAGGAVDGGTPAGVDADVDADVDAGVDADGTADPDADVDAEADTETDGEAGSSSQDPEEDDVPLDAEMEDALAADVESDPLAAYDVDVTREGAEIARMIARLDA